MHWHITRYETIFGVANQLPVSLPSCSYRLELCRLFKMMAQYLHGCTIVQTFKEAKSSVLEITVLGH